MISRAVSNWEPGQGPLREQILDIVWDTEHKAWLIVLKDRIIRLPKGGGDGEILEQGSQGAR